jgi:hypothetical protein
MSDDGEVWLGDDEEPELEVLPVPHGAAPAQAPASPPVRRARRKRLEPSKGVPVAGASEARRQVLAEATGRATTEQDWRTELELGQRNRAAGSLTTGGRRRGSGFGLA